jgi:hypothetical protein
MAYYSPVEKSELYKLKLKRDKHWNAEGHKVAAAAVLETLRPEAICNEGMDWICQ